MADIAMCGNKKCPLKYTCYRFRAKPNPYHQSYMLFIYNEKDGCKNFWDISGRRDYELKHRE